MADQLKAYVVTELGGDEQAEIVFAAHNVVARREGAAMLGEDFEGVSCERAKVFDRFAPGPVEIIDRLKAGWWWECSGCYRAVTDGYVRNEDHEEIEATPIPVPGGIFCGAECKAAHEQEGRDRKAAEEAALTDMRVELLRTFPGVTLSGHDHAYVERKDGVTFSPSQVWIGFTFPGSRIGDAHWRFDAPGEEHHVTVCNGDLTAWKAWRYVELGRSAERNATRLASLTASIARLEAKYAGRAALADGESGR